MSKKFGSLLKSGLMGSSTMPMGAGGSMSFMTPVHTHEHAADGSCCGHDHGHHHHHESAADSDHDHVHDEHCCGGHHHK